MNDFASLSNFPSLGLDTETNQMKAIRRFKAILERHRAASPKHTEDAFNPLEAKARAAEIEAFVQRRQTLSRHGRDDIIKQLTLDPNRPTNSHDEDVTEQEPLFLGVGAGGGEAHHKPPSSSDPHDSAVSESPTNTDFNVYDKAYEEEVERIMANPSRQRPTTYLTRLVEERGQYETGGILSSEKTPSSGGVTDVVSQILSEAVAKTTVDGDRS